MIAQVQQTEVEKAIASSQHHGYYDTLVKNEPCINWFALCAKLYRVSHSIVTGMNYCKSVCVFREMLAQNYKITLCAAITEIKANEKRAYELLDEFVTWCDAVKQYKPRTTRSFFINVTKVLRYAGIELEESKLEDISLPRPTEMADDYPENSAILGILNAASLTIRGYLQLILDTGFEAVDAAQLQIKDIHFDEAMPRINKAREKTGKKLEGFLSDETANTIKALIETKSKGPDDCVFCKSYEPHSKQTSRRLQPCASKGWLWRGSQGKARFQGSHCKD